MKKDKQLRGDRVIKVESDPNARTVTIDWSDGADGTEQERTELFDVAGTLALDLRTASGDVRLSESPNATCTVRAVARGSEARERLERVTIEYDDATSTLLVDTQTGLRFDKGRGPLSIASGKRFFEILRHTDVDLYVEIPAGATLTMKSASGDVTAIVPLASADVKSASGDIVLNSVAGSATVTIASGDVVIRESGGDVSVKTTSGDIEVTAHGDAELRSVSGDIQLVVGGPMDATINAVSGDVLVRVASGLVIDVDATTVSGDLTSQIDLSTSGDGAPSPSPEVRLSVRTVSGDVAIRRG